MATLQEGGNMSIEDNWNFIVKTFKDEIRHQIDVITDSDWFMELVEEKVKKEVKRVLEGVTDV